jgi:hypothetical protein
MQNPLETLHYDVSKAVEALEKLALPGETHAQTIIRLGNQHPVVRRRDQKIHAYRRAASQFPWRQDVRH